MTASILVNIAFDLAHRADENYFAIWPEAGPAQNLIETFMDFLGPFAALIPFISTNRMIRSTTGWQMALNGSVYQL